MPHLTVEYSSNVAAHHDIDALLDVIHERLLSFDFVPVPGIRIRAVAHDKTRIADGSEEHFAFIAMVARLGPGRDDETKHLLMSSVLDAAVAQVDNDGGPLHIAWSFEIQEIDAEFRLNKNNIRSHIEDTQTNGNS